MSKTESSKIENALVSTLGVSTGIFVATLLQRLLGASLPVPFWILNILAGAGLVYYGSTTEDGAIGEFAIGFGASHFSVGAFNGLKQLTGAAALPTINGMRGLPRPELAPSSDRSLEQNVLRLGLGEITEDDRRAYSLSM